MKDPLSDFDLSKSPEPGRPSRWARSLPGAAWLFLLAILVFVVPRFESIFADFGVDLPRIVVYLIRASHVVVRQAPTILIIVVAAWVSRSAVCNGNETDPCRTTRTVMFLIPAALIVAALIALGMTVSNLGSRLTG